jgi:methionyl-tRNA formyltransferase
MRISILTTSKDHPINFYTKQWAKEKVNDHSVDILHSKEGLSGGDILFLISCSDIISKVDRDKFKKILVIHASDLPFGRGWSPYIWEIINGATDITLSLLEAKDKVDSGDIWTKVKVNISKTDLFNEINHKICNAEIALMNFAITNFGHIQAIKQVDTDASYWSKRSPKDSEIDINKSLAEQFDLLRVCDPNRFPAFFYKEGQRFNITISKYDE